MRYFRPRTLAQTLALLAMLGLASCAGVPNTSAIPVALDCSRRVPPQLKKPTEPAPLPTENTVGEWVAFGDAQTGQLGQANDAKATVVWIIDACEAEERAAVEALTAKPWWRRITGL
jgi:hypothetical protein